MFDQGGAVGGVYDGKGMLEVLCAAGPAHLVEPFHVQVDYCVGNVRL